MADRVMFDDRVIVKYSAQADLLNDLFGSVDAKGVPGQQVAIPECHP